MSETENKCISRATDDITTSAQPYLHSHLLEKIQEENILRQEQFYKISPQSKHLQEIKLLGKNFTVWKESWRIREILCIRGNKRRKGETSCLTRKKRKISIGKGESLDSCLREEKYHQGREVFRKDSPSVSRMIQDQNSPSTTSIFSGRKREGGFLRKRDQRQLNLSLYLTKKKGKGNTFLSREGVSQQTEPGNTCFLPNWSKSNSNSVARQCECSKWVPNLGPTNKKDKHQNAKLANPVKAKR